MHRPIRSKPIIFMPLLLLSQFRFLLSRFTSRPDFCGPPSPLTDLYRFHDSRHRWRRVSGEKSYVGEDDAGKVGVSPKVNRSPTRYQNKSTPKCKSSGRV